MGSIKIAFRRLFRKGEYSFTRILSLAAGLAFSILLLSEVFYYYSFDGFYSDSDRVYVVHENFKMDKSSDKLESYARVSGAIAPGLKAEVPGVEEATRLNGIGSSVFYTEDRKDYKADFSLADENLFRVLPRPVISGDPFTILKSPMQCMVSSKIAVEMGGDVIGKIIELKEYPNKKLTISGIFEVLPENTNYKYDILISMVSTSEFLWDGTENWLGNDRYYACVRLAKGYTPEQIAPAVRKMQEKYQDIVKLEEANNGMVLKYTFEPITRLYSNAAKDMILILSFIAFAVLFVSMMNYILLTLSALVNRAKTSAIHKCCGAQVRNLQGIIFSETVLVFFISLLAAFLIILALKPFAEAQVGHRLSSALNPQVVWPLLGIMVLLVLLVSYLPGRFFSRIPVANAFRTYRQKGNKWKLALLFMQFIGASFIITMLVVVVLQYNRMMRADHGYSTEGVYVASTSGVDGNKISTILNEIRSLPEIERVGLGCCLPIEGASGNNVLSEDRERELFNVADFYYIDENYLDILNIPVVEGANFSSEKSSPYDLLISRKCAEMLKMNNGWTDGVVGKQIEITEHNSRGANPIVGIFPDFIVGSMTNADSRPSVFFYLPHSRFEQLKVKYPSFTVYVLAKARPGVGAGAMDRITSVFNAHLPFMDASVSSLADEQQQCYRPERGFRNAMLAGNFVILLVTAIGLLGYTTSEATRRRKELAIRQINGAEMRDILRMFILDLEYIAIPAVIIGLMAAWLLAVRWMQNFSSKITLHWWLFALCSLVILFAIAIVAAVNYIRIANRNPVDSLRYE